MHQTGTSKEDGLSISMLVDKQFNHGSTLIRTEQWSRIGFDFKTGEMRQSLLDSGLLQVGENSGVSNRVQVLALEQVLQVARVLEGIPFRTGVLFGIESIADVFTQLRSPTMIHAMLNMIDPPSSLSEAHAVDPNTAIYYQILTVFLRRNLNDESNLFSASASDPFRIRLQASVVKIWDIQDLAASTKDPFQRCWEIVRDVVEFNAVVTMYGDKVSNNGEVCPDSLRTMIETIVTCSGVCSKETHTIDARQSRSSPFFSQPSFCICTEILKVLAFTSKNVVVHEYILDQFLLTEVLREILDLWVASPVIENSAVLGVGCIWSLTGMFMQTLTTLYSTYPGGNTSCVQGLKRMVYFLVRLVDFLGETVSRCENPDLHKFFEKKNYRHVADYYQMTQPSRITTPKIWVL